MTLTPMTPDLHPDVSAGSTCFGGATRHRTWRAMPVKSTPPIPLSPPSNHTTSHGVYRPMTVGDEVNFAWALMTEAESLVTRRERMRICVILGAGESTRTIEHLLASIAAQGMALSDHLADSAFDWFVGFSGTSDEPRLRSLVESVCHASSRISERLQVSSGSVSSTAGCGSSA